MCIRDRQLNWDLISECTWTTNSLAVFYVVKISATHLLLENTLWDVLMNWELVVINFCICVGLLWPCVVLQRTVDPYRLILCSDSYLVYCGSWYIQLHCFGEFELKTDFVTDSYHLPIVNSCGYCQLWLLAVLCVDLYFAVYRSFFSISCKRSLSFYSRGGQTTAGCLHPAHRHILSSPPRLPEIVQ